MNKLLLSIFFYTAMISAEPIWKSTSVRQIEPRDVSSFTKLPTKINLNHADKPTLLKLTGIGEKKAQMIITYRTEHGPFKSIQELLKIKGFTKKVLQKIIEKNPDLLSVE